MQIIIPKKIVYSVTAGIVIGLASLVFAQASDSKDETDEGMESIRVNDAVTVFAPKGTKIDKSSNGVIKIESPNRYMARRLAEMDKRLHNIEATQETLKKEIAQLKASDTQQSAVLSAKKEEAQNTASQSRLMIAAPVQEETAQGTPVQNAR
jgi:hypothetical protein